MPPRASRRRTVVEYARARLRADCAEERGVQARVRRVTGFSTAHISNAINPQSQNPRGLGDEFLRALAEKWWGISYAHLLTLAEKWAKQQERSRTVPPADPYPERARATRKLAGVVTPDVLSVLRSVQPQGEYTEADWMAHAFRIRERIGADAPASAPAVSPHARRKR